MHDQFALTSILPSERARRCRCAADAAAMVPGASGCATSGFPAFVAGRDGLPSLPDPLRQHTETEAHWEAHPGNKEGQGREPPNTGNKSNGPPQTSPKRKNTGRVSPDPLLLLPLSLCASFLSARGQRPPPPCHSRSPDCKYVQSISSQNLATGSNPPAGKTLHKNCPLH